MSQNTASPIGAQAGLGTPAAGIDYSDPRHHSLRGTVLLEFPFVALLSLALAGMCLASLSHSYATEYWVALTPVAALICIYVGWHRFAGHQQRVRLVIMQALQWLGVVAAMWLISVSDAHNLLNDDSTALMMLTVLSLGVFISAIFVQVWQLALVSLFLAAAVPTIAWVEEASVALFLIGSGLIVVTLAYFVIRWFMRRWAAS